VVFLEVISKWLLFVHLVGTGVLLGGMTHDLVLIVGYWRGKFRKKKLGRLYVKVSFWAYVTVFFVGALVYPTFRVRVRHEYFDKCVPWATGLFEVREHWAAIGLALFIAYYFLRRSSDPERDREKLFLQTGILLILYIIVWYCATVGFYLTTVKSV
jgi:hypothetical protein